MPIDKKEIVKIIVRRENENIRGWSWFCRIGKAGREFCHGQQPTTFRNCYDSLEQGVLATIPICKAEFSSEWQQGREYDLLVVADTSATYQELNIHTGSRCETVHCEASSKEITQATDFLDICIKALAEILASDSNMLLGPMGEFLDACRDEGHTAESLTVFNLMRVKLEMLESLRSSLSESGKVEVPSIKPNRATKAVLKIDMEAYMEKSGVNTLPTGFYPYPYPWLVGMKAAINIYFGHTNVKLHPTCQPTPHDEDSDDDDSGDEDSDDEDSDDEDYWYLDALHGSSPCATGAAQHISIRKEDLSLPQDVSVVSDDDDETSVITADGEYRVPL